MNTRRHSARVGRRVLIYGTAGIGKTTWAAQAAEPAFVLTEDGLGQNEVDHFPRCDTYAEAFDCIRQLIAEDHSYRTVVLDSVSALERMVWAALLEADGKRDLQSYGWWKGYEAARDRYWPDLLMSLDHLVDAKEMDVILIGHSEITKFKGPETDDYNRYMPALHPTLMPVIAQWCDAVLFASYAVHTVKAGDRTVAKGTGERTVKTEERPAFLAKNRYSLPSEIPLDWGEFDKLSRKEKQCLT